MQKLPLAFLVLLALFTETTSQTAKVKPGTSRTRSTLCTKAAALDTLKQQMVIEPCLESQKIKSANGKAN